MRGLNSCKKVQLFENSHILNYMLLATKLYLLSINCGVYQYIFEVINMV